MPPKAKDAPWFGSFEHTLVFTDTQYWRATTSAMSLPNHIMATSLHDSHCVFIGLSMTDINLLRWFAMRHIQLIEDQEQRAQSIRFHREAREETPPSPRLRRAFIPPWKLRRHFWIRPEGDDPSGFLSEFLWHRGIAAVPITSWADDSFKELMEECLM